MNNLVRNRHERPRIIRQRRFCHENERFAVLKPFDDFSCRLSARKLAEELLDVLDFKRAGLEWVLLDQVFHQVSMPITLPSSLTSSLCACGVLPRPGISIMLPATATTNPEPADKVASVTLSVQPLGAPSNRALSENEYCVFATHTGSAP